jgi:hypothetical protein
MPFTAPTPHSASPNVGNYRVGRGFCSVQLAGDAAPIDVGNVVMFEFELKPTLLPHYSTRVGVQKKDLVATTRLDATLTMALEELTAHNMQMALLGTSGKVGSTYTIDALSTPQIYAAVNFTDTSAIGPEWSAFFPLVLFTPNKVLSLISGGSGAWSTIDLQADVLFDNHTGLFAAFSSDDIASP